MAVIVNIVSGRDVSIHTRRGNWSSKGKLVLYKPLLHCNNHLNSCSYVKRRKASVMKVGVVDIDIRVLSY